MKEAVESATSTLSIERGRYCGASVPMVQAYYCELPGLAIHTQVSPQQSTEIQPDQTKIKPETSHYLQNMVAGPGFEPGTSRL